MCLPEVIFFDDKSGDRHSRRRGNALLRPLSADSDDPPPLLSSPPFVVQVSPKLGHHHHHHRPSIRYARAPSRSPLPSPRRREETEWREGFRAGREAVRTRDSEERERGTAEVRKKTVTLEDEATSQTPEIVITKSTAKSPPTPTPTTIPHPAAPAPHPTNPAKADPVPPPQPTPPAPVPRDPPRHPPRRPSPSSSTSSLSLRALRHRLSALWTHITTLERERERGWGRGYPTAPVRSRGDVEVRRVRERIRERNVAEGVRGGRASARRGGNGGGGGRVRRSVVIVDSRR